MLTYTAFNDKDLKNPKYFFFTERCKEILTRSAVLNVFATVSRPILSDVPKELLSASMIKASGSKDVLNYLKTIFCVHIPHKPVKKEFTEKTDPSTDQYVYGVLFIPNVDDACMLIKLTDDATKPPFDFYEQFVMAPGMIPNYHGDKPVVTDVGKFFANYLLLVHPFGDKTDYINKTMKTGMMDDIVVKLILEGKAGRNEFNKYMTLGYWFYEDGSLTLQPWSEYAMTTSDEITKKKKELFAKYKDSLDDPQVITKIEKELMDMDKEYIKGDVTEPFFNLDPKKGFGDWRKKMYIAFGGAPSFDSNKVTFSTADESLEEGWKIEHLDIAANDIRRGTYNRHRETAKGGEQTKFLLRIFQNVKITEEDCKSPHGTVVTLTEVNYKNYVGRYLVGSNKPLTKEELQSSLGKTVEIRSPLHCKVKGGFCYKCCGDFFKNVGIETIGMQGLTVTSSMTNTAMKAMHSSQITTGKVTDINRFLIK